jgi:hypothetical protein
MPLGTQPGDREYVVYGLIRHRTLWQWLFRWLPPTYELRLGRSAVTADEAMANAQVRINAPPRGHVIGIAAHALACCSEKHYRVGDLQAPADG